MKALLLIALSFSSSLFSQKVSGLVTDEDRNPISSVLVFNVKTEQKTYTDPAGEFTIEAAPNDELRFIRQGFERNSKIVNAEDFKTPFSITIIRSVQNIEEVKIVQSTGNLEKDLKNYGDTKPVAKLKSETSKYIRSKSTPEVLAPKPGEFVQPVGPGFSLGGGDNQWDDVDFMEFLLGNITLDFFTDDLKLKNTEIQPFIYYIFRNFDRREVLFRGVCTQYDLSRFIKESYLKIEAYRKNLPNIPPNMKKRKRL